MIVPKGNDLYVIRLFSSETMALSVSGGGQKDGTPIVLTQDSEAAWQR